MLKCFSNDLKPKKICKNKVKKLLFVTMYVPD